MSSPYQPTDLRYANPNNEIPEAYRRPRPPVTTTPAPVLSVPSPDQAPEQPTMTDALAQDAAPPEFAPGSPGLTPFLRLPFRRRSEFLRKVAPIEQSTQNLPEKGTQAGVEEAAFMFEVMADMDEILEMVAVDVDAYREWVANATDQEFSDLFFTYLARTQLGEAKSSSS